MREPDHFVKLGSQDCAGEEGRHEIIDLRVSVDEIFDVVDLDVLTKLLSLQNSLTLSFTTELARRFCNLYRSPSSTDEWLERLEDTPEARITASKHQPVT